MARLLESGSQCMESARRGVRWLLEEQGLDGSWKSLPDAPFDAYYRAAWTLGLLGEGGAAERELNYVRQRFLTAEGDFAPRENGWYHNVHYSYPNAILAVGAHLRGRYDLSVPATRFLLTQQDPQHGGFFMVRGEAGESPPSNTLTTAMCGIACLACGQMEAAVRAGDWLERLIELQPVPAERFYTTTTADGRLRTGYSDDAARWHAVEVKKEGTQCWYAVGLPFAFALLLKDATGDERYGKVAEWLFDLQTRCVNPWDGPSSGKGAWACSILYRLTGERRYRDVALQVANNFADRQTPEGWFRGWLYVEPKPGDPKVTVRQFESTTEFGMWLALIGENLLARDPE